MTLLYCEVCKSFIPIKIFNFHKHQIKYTIDLVPNDLTNIICDYKYQLEVFEKYKRFVKFVNFFNTITYETISVNYNCNYNKSINYYLDDMVYIMENTFPSFNFDIRQMVTGKKLKKKYYSIKIIKFNIEYNTFNKKYYIRYL